MCYLIFQPPSNFTNHTPSAHIPRRLIALTSHYALSRNLPSMQRRKPLTHLVQNIHNVLIIHRELVVRGLTRRATDAEAARVADHVLAVVGWFAWSEDLVQSKVEEEREHVPLKSTPQSPASVRTPRHASWHSAAEGASGDVVVRSM
jgi:hypothetical protein